MSAPPNKRLHEEAASGGSSGTSGGVGAQTSKYPNDDSAAGHPVVGPKLGPSVASSDHHHHHHHQHAQPFDHAVQQDAQIPFKIRSPLLPMYHNRVSPSSNDSHFDHSVAASENRSESRDNARDLKAENRDARDLYQSGKEKDSKEAKHDRDKDDYHPDFKDDSMKTEKEGYGPGNSHLSWKESKEHHRGGKRYPDIPGGNVDQLHASRANLQGPVEREAGKEFSAPEERDYYDAHEAVGENKFDLKGEDKFKERDRKRKDLKHRDLLDKDKNERRNNLHLGSSSGDGKEPAVEESEAERWERERKDTFRDKEKPKEREKEHVKREAWNGAEKDGLQNDKEPVDAYARTSEAENSTLGPKKQRDHEGWKKNDGEARERKKGRDADVDEERPEKRSRWYDKDSDDGCADTELGTEKERENFSYGVQQRKRMLRPRGSPQVANREPRFRSRTQDNEGVIDGSLMPSRRLMLLEATDEEEEHQCHCNSIEGENYDIFTNGHVERSQGKHEASTVVYRVGECMEELMKLWKEYEASQSDRKSESESSQNGPTLEIRIPAEHVTATNRQVRGGQLWGTDVYTYDSDLVAILMHTGYCRPTASPPPPAIQELRVTVRVLPPQDCYISTLRNNVRSRAWGAAIGCSYRIERCCIVKKGGGTIALEPCLTHTSTLEPTLAPVVVERTMTTRAAASNALRQQRFVREVTIQYNLCNEPWIKYSLSIVADKGLKKPLYTSARLKKGEVLYLETHSRRYELCFSGEKVVKATSSQMHDTETERSQSHNSHSANVERGGVVDGDSVLINVFRWSRCKKLIPQKLMLSIGIPLPAEHLEVLEENLDWEDIQWSQTGVLIAGKELPLARVHFLAPN